MTRIFIAPEQSYADPITGEPSRGPFAGGFANWPDGAQAHEITPGWFLVVAPTLNAAPDGTFDLGDNQTVTVSVALGGNAARNRAKRDLDLTDADLDQTVGALLVQLLDRNGGTLVAGRNGRYQLNLAGVTLVDLPVVAGGAVAWTQDFTTASAGRLQTVLPDFTDTSNFFQVDATSDYLGWTQNNQQGYFENDTTPTGSGDHYLQYNGWFTSNATYAAHGAILRGDGSGTAANDGYRCLVANDVGSRYYYISVITAGSKTDLSSTTDGASAADSSSKLWKIEVDGNTISWYEDGGGTPVWTYGSATSHTTNEYVGGYMGKYGGGSIMMTNLEAGTVGGGATAPAAIADLAGTPGNAQVALTWSAPSDGGSAITDYEYRVDGGTWTSIASTTPGFTVTGLTNGVSYDFEVRAVNAIGSATASNLVSSTPVADLPSAIADLTATPGDGQVTLAWSAPADGGAAITDYLVEYRTQSLLDSDDFTSQGDGSQWLPRTGWTAGSHNTVFANNWLIYAPTDVMYCSSGDQWIAYDTSSVNHRVVANVKTSLTSDAIGGVMVAIDTVDSYKHIGFEIVYYDNAGSEDKMILYYKTGASAGVGETVLWEDTSFGFTDETWYELDLAIEGNVVTAKVDGVTVYSAALNGTQISELAARNPTAAGPVTWQGSPNFDDIAVYGAGSWSTFTDGVSASTGATVTGLTNGTAYEFRVSAINSVGTGPSSNVDSATPVAAGTPAYIGSLNIDDVKIGTSQVTAIYIGTNLVWQ